MTGNQMQQRAQQPSVVDLLQGMKPEIQRALPQHLTGDRFARLALTAIRKTPRLAGCNPESFFGALLTAAALGLEPNVNGEAYLVPYGRECQLIVGYQGLVKLFLQSPLAARIDAQCVYANDEFRYSKGEVQELHHVPALTNRGELLGVYAVAELTTGVRNFEYLTMDDVAALRGKDERETTKGDVRDPMHWMARKTAIRQVLKLMPKSTELQHTLQVDERPGSMQIAQAIKDNDVLPEVEPVNTDGLVDFQTGEVLDGEALPIEEPQ